MKFYSIFFFLIAGDCFQNRHRTPIKPSFSRKYAPSVEMSQANAGHSSTSIFSTQISGDDFPIKIPPPLNDLVDVNLERNSVVYEVTLGRELGIEIEKSKSGSLVVAKVEICCPQSATAHNRISLFPPTTLFSSADYRWWPTARQRC